MFRSITRLSFGLILTASLTLAKSASADEKVAASGAAKGVVTLIFLDNVAQRGVQAWSASGRDLSNDVLGDVELIGDHTTTGVTFFDLAEGSASGIFRAVSTEYPGTSVSGSFEGEIGFDNAGNLLLNVAIQWEAGEGRLAGVAGSADAQVLQSPFDNAGMATHSYTYDGVFKVPALPELPPKE